MAARDEASTLYDRIEDAASDLQRMCESKDEEIEKLEQQVERLQEEVESLMDQIADMQKGVN